MKRALTIILIVTVLLCACTDHPDPIEQIPLASTAEPQVDEQQLDENATVPTASNTEPQNINTGLSVVTVGTGTPMYDSQKASSSTMIKYNNEFILVDCGEGSYSNIMEAGYSFKNMTGLLFTHMHLDHTADYISITIPCLLATNTHLDIVGPPTTASLYELIESTFAEDIEYRLANISRRGGQNTPTDAWRSSATVTELVGQNELKINDIDITTAQMTHSAYTLAYRFDIDGKSIVVSGDTDYDPDLITLAEGCDILVIDASSVLSANNPPRKNNNTTRAHMSFDDIVSIASDTGARTLVLTHYPSIDDAQIDKITQQILDTYDGQVIFAEDMMEIFA